jgi:phosphoribosyl 1,2-cyclic phosphodiesterase
MRARVVNALRRGVRAGIADDDIERFVDEDLSFHERATFGGNSSCVEIEIPGEDYVLCDAGSGLREFGNNAIAKHGPSNPQTYHLFQSHLHWDHIMGFPFFTPAYIPGNRVVIYSCHHEAREAFMSQQSAPSFPVDFSALGAAIEFVPMEPGTSIEVGGITVSAHLQNHGGDSYGYRFEHGNKAVVYSTDGEHKLESREDTAAMIEFYRGADLVIFARGGQALLHVPSRTGLRRRDDRAGSGGDTPL